MIHELIDAAGALHLRARADGAWSAWSSPADAEALAGAIAGLATDYLATGDGYKRKLATGTLVMNGSQMGMDGSQPWATLISHTSWNSMFGYKADVQYDRAIAYNAEPGSNGHTVRGTSIDSDGNVRFWMEERPSGGFRVSWIAIGRIK